MTGGNLLGNHDDGDDGGGKNHFHHHNHKHLLERLPAHPDDFQLFILPKISFPTNLKVFQRSGQCNTWDW